VIADIDADDDSFIADERQHPAPGETFNDLPCQSAIVSWNTWRT
jgi:hypothetical protein